MPKLEPKQLPLPVFKSLQISHLSYSYLSTILQMNCNSASSLSSLSFGSLWASNQLYNPHLLIHDAKQYILMMQYLIISLVNRTQRLLKGLTLILLFTFYAKESEPWQILIAKDNSQGKWNSLISLRGYEALYPILIAFAQVNYIQTSPNINTPGILTIPFQGLQSSFSLSNWVCKRVFIVLTMISVYWKTLLRKHFKVQKI